MLIGIIGNAYKLNMLKRSALSLASSAPVVPKSMATGTEKVVLESGAQSDASDVQDVVDDESRKAIRHARRK